MIEPDYYKSEDGKDLIAQFEEQFSIDEFRGFMKGNVIKYLTRYTEKNGVEDLNKAMTYLTRLTDYEDQHSEANSIRRAMHELAMAASGSVNHDKVRGRDK